MRRKYLKKRKNMFLLEKYFLNCKKLGEIKQMGSKLQGAKFDLRDHEIFREIFKINNNEALLIFNRGE